MNSTKLRLAAPLLALALGGCANTDAIDVADKNQFVTEFYAFVHDVRDVDFESYVGPAIAYGAVHGAIEGAYHGDRYDILGGAIVGGLISGFITTLFEGPTDGWEYQLNAVDGDTVTVVLDYEPAQVGDCVRVRVSGSVHIFKEADAVCQEEYFFEEE